MADDKQWTEDDLQLWIDIMYYESMTQAQAAAFMREFRQWNAIYRLNSLTHHISTHYTSNEERIQTT